MADDEQRLRQVERGLSKVMHLMEPMMMRHGGSPFVFDQGAHKPCLPRDYYALSERNQEVMSKLPEITADTADELNEKTAAAKAEQERQAAIRRLAAVATEADTMRDRAHKALKTAKAARKALKGVRNNPDATVEDISTAIKASKLGR